jgi:hypothetical protein
MNFWAPGDLPTEAGSDVRWFWSMTVLVDWRLGIVTWRKVATLDEAKARFRESLAKARGGDQS